MGGINEVVVVEEIESRGGGGGGILHSSERAQLEAVS